MTLLAMILMGAFYAAPYLVFARKHPSLEDFGIVMAINVLSLLLYSVVYMITQEWLPKIGFEPEQGIALWRYHLLGAAVLHLFYHLFINVTYETEHGLIERVKNA